jgi:hypothetical protein
MKRYVASHRNLTDLNLSGSNNNAICIGTCTDGARQGERCCQWLANADWNAGINKLASLEAKYDDEAALKQDLAYAAGKLLCVRFHQDQKHDIVEEWSNVKQIRDLLSQSPSE